VAHLVNAIRKIIEKDRENVLPFAAQVLAIKPAHVFKKANTEEKNQEGIVSQSFDPQISGVESTA